MQTCHGVQPFEFQYAAYRFVPVSGTSDPTSALQRWSREQDAWCEVTHWVGAPSEATKRFLTQTTRADQPVAVFGDLVFQHGRIWRVVPDEPAHASQLHAWSDLAPGWQCAYSGIDQPAEALLSRIAQTLQNGRPVQITPTLLLNTIGELFQTRRTPGHPHQTLLMLWGVLGWETIDLYEAPDPETLLQEIYQELAR